VPGREKEAAVPEMMIMLVHVTIGKDQVLKIGNGGEEKFVQDAEPPIRLQQLGCRSQLVAAGNLLLPTTMSPHPYCPPPLGISPRELREVQRRDVVGGVIAAEVRNAVLYVQKAHLRMYLKPCWQTLLITTWQIPMMTHLKELCICFKMSMETG
jgi:hypothetical protein